VSPRPKTSRAGASHVLVVADNRETLDGLQAYLQRAGVSARGSSQLDGPAWEHPTIHAVVLFPDDFEEGDVMQAAVRLALARPNVLRVLVTREPRRFGLLLKASEATPPPVILPKPAWGWTILEVIRTMSVASA
jgi:hypothetical protein